MCFEYKNLRKRFQIYTEDTGFLLNRYTLNIKDPSIQKMMETDRTKNFHRIYIPVLVTHSMDLVAQVHNYFTKPGVYPPVRMVTPCCYAILMIVWGICRWIPTLRKNPKTIYINFIYLLILCGSTYTNYALSDQLPENFQKNDQLATQGKFFMMLIIIHLANFTSLLFSCFVQVPICILTFWSIVDIQAKWWGDPSTGLPVEQQDPQKVKLYVFIRIICVSWVLFVTVWDNYLRQYDLSKKTIENVLVRQSQT